MSAVCEDVKGAHMRRCRSPQYKQRQKGCLDLDLMQRWPRLVELELSTLEEKALMTGCSVPGCIKFLLPCLLSYLIVSFLNMETIEVNIFSYSSGG